MTDRLKDAEAMLERYNTDEDYYPDHQDTMPILEYLLAEVRRLREHADDWKPLLKPIDAVEAKP